MDDSTVSRRPSAMLKKRSAPIFSSETKANPLTTQKKSHRVAALLETLHSREIEDLPLDPPSFSRSFSENDAKQVINAEPSSWSHLDYDLLKDTIREFLDEVN